MYFAQLIILCNKMREGPDPMPFVVFIMFFLFIHYFSVYLHAACVCSFKSLLKIVLKLTLFPTLGATSPFVNPSWHKLSYHFSHHNIVEKRVIHPNFMVWALISQILLDFTINFSSSSHSEQMNFYHNNYVMVRNWIQKALYKPPMGYPACSAIMIMLK